jgi:SSS family transporter
MDPILTAIVIGGYFLLLIVISFITGKKADNETFFLGNRKSPWYIVSIGMIGASLSGVTFISVPGWVGNTGFTYMQMVFGYFLGYLTIAHILLPLYYKLNLTSIYTYLNTRFGLHSYKSGAVLFILSRTTGAAARLFLMANVLQLTLFDALGIPFEFTVFITIALIWLYTFRGGIKTIIWTDTLQTVFMLTSVILTIVFIASSMNLSFSGLINTIKESDFSTMFVFDDFHSKQNFFKQFFSGAFITIVMTGLDQDMMQKNLTCRNLKDAQKNMYWYGAAFVPVNMLFLGLGALLFIFANNNGIPIPERADNLFPLIATGGYLPEIVGVIFILGLVAAAYSSADSALTSLTTSFSVDIINISRFDENKAKRIRLGVHIGFSIVLMLVIMLFKALSNESIISTLFTLAGYTYGPLLGLYAFGLFSKRTVPDKWIPVIAIASPVLTGILDFNSTNWFGFQLGFEKLIINGAITIVALIILSKSKKN